MRGVSISIEKASDSIDASLRRGERWMFTISKSVAGEGNFKPPARKGAVAWTGCWDQPGESYDRLNHVAHLVLPKRSNRIAVPRLYVGDAIERGKLAPTPCNAGGFSIPFTAKECLDIYDAPLTGSVLNKLLKGRFSKGGSEKLIYMPPASSQTDAERRKGPSGGENLYEGAAVTTPVNRYERNKVARRRCIEKYGTRCCVCEMSFSERYGRLGAGFIHVHHLVPQAKIRKSYKVDPVKDLRPVCPNCHAMLHIGDLTPEKLRARIRHV